MYFLLQSCIIFAVCASNIHWHWTPNGYRGEIAERLSRRNDGVRFGTGVRVGTREQAQLYASSVPRPIAPDSYVTVEIVARDERPSNWVWFDRHRETMVGFAHGTCGSLNWRPLNE